MITARSFRMDIHMYLKEAHHKAGSIQLFPIYEFSYRRDNFKQQTHLYKKISWERKRSPEMLRTRISLPVEEKHSRTHGRPATSLPKSLKLFQSEMKTRGKRRPSVDWELRQSGFSWLAPALFVAPISPSISFAYFDRGFVSVLPICQSLPAFTVNFRNTFSFTETEKNPVCVRRNYRRRHSPLRSSLVPLLLSLSLALR